MKRRGFLGALLGLPLIKWLKPKERPSKVEVYFPVVREVKWPASSPDGEPIFARYEALNGNVIHIDGIRYKQADWVEFEKVLRAWSNG